MGRLKSSSVPIAPISSYEIALVRSLKEARLSLTLFACYASSSHENYDPSVTLSIIFKFYAFIDSLVGIKENPI